MLHDIGLMKISGNNGLMKINGGIARLLYDFVELSTAVQID